MVGGHCPCSISNLLDDQIGCFERLPKYGPITQPRSMPVYPDAMFYGESRATSNGDDKIQYS